MRWSRALSSRKGRRERYVAPMHSHSPHGLRPSPQKRGFGGHGSISKQFYYEQGLQLSKSNLQKPTAGPVGRFRAGAPHCVQWASPRCAGRRRVRRGRARIARTPLALRPLLAKRRPGRVGTGRRGARHLPRRPFPRRVLRGSAACRAHALQPRRRAGARAGTAPVHPLRRARAGQERPPNGCGVHFSCHSGQVSQRES